MGERAKCSSPPKFSMDNHHNYSDQISSKSFKLNTFANHLLVPIPFWQQILPLLLHNFQSTITLQNSVIIHKLKILPVFIENFTWRKVTSKLMTTLPESSLQTKSYIGTSLKLQYVDIDVFRIVQRYFTKTNSEFHTLPLTYERLLKVVIKRLPIDIVEDEITSA